ncbi:23152_t:CDS:2 [Racocetra persica]|uniref:23152_t:CDS:1 n=1 Tax=Racocetra persica TaxID=160502 RepID=A0ACA9Q1V6_9GLOM|nr:23152_t:CDS:2 [Racocetra persica]
METTMENTVNNTEGQLTKKEIEAQERAKRRAEKETQQLADNKYRIEKVFDNDSHQVEGGFYNDYFPLKKNDKGFYLVDYTVRKIETKGYYGSAGRFGDTINYLVRHLKKVEEAEARERDLKDFQELG